MKKVSFLFLVFVIGFILLSSNHLNAQIPGVQWNTFLGNAGTDEGGAVVVDGSGKIFCVGRSTTTWGTPINSYNGGYDVFVACLDNAGNLLWNTFMGGLSDDSSYAIELSGSGNIYVFGSSASSWGTPINAYSGGTDTFVACLDNAGNMLWSTFLGSSIWDQGNDLYLGGTGNIYVTGYSDSTWGSPVNAHSGNPDAFVACLNSSGNLVWNTFLGGASQDKGWDVALDSSGNVYACGMSYATWGSPVNAHSGSGDAFVACLDSSGNLIWNTFLGSSGYENGINLTLGGSGNVYVIGSSAATWGSPVNAYSGAADGYVACLDSSGNLVWNTFLGCVDDDWIWEIVLDSSGNIYLTGTSQTSWGSPVNAHSEYRDVYIAYLNGSGNLIWNTFLGSTGSDWGHGIALDSQENIYLTGQSDVTWGTPINPHAGQGDIFVAKVTPVPVPIIEANGSGDPISITQSDSLQMRVTLRTLGSTDNVDFWLAYKGPSGWVHYNNTTKKWESGLGVTHQGPLMDLNNKKVFQKSGLAPGVYTFYFGVDMNMDGKVTKSSLYKDEVQVTVTQ